MMALTFPAICSPLQTIIEVERYSHLQDLDLADVSSTNDHVSNAVDILIGSDYYWDVVIGRGKCGPVAIRSKFGWLLSGPVRSTNAASNEVVSNLILEGPNVSETFENDSQLVEDLRDTEIVGISPEPKEVERDSFMEIKDIR